MSFSVSDIQRFQTKFRSSIILHASTSCTLDMTVSENLKSQALLWSLWFSSNVFNRRVPPVDLNYIQLRELQVWHSLSTGFSIPHKTTSLNFDHFVAVYNGRITLTGAELDWQMPQPLGTLERWERWEPWERWRSRRAIIASTLRIWFWSQLSDLSDLPQQGSFPA